MQVLIYILDITTNCNKCIETMTTKTIGSSAAFTSRHDAYYIWI